MTVTQGTPPNHLVWWPTVLTLVVPQDCIYLHTLKAAAWGSGFQAGADLGADWELRVMVIKMFINLEEEWMEQGCCCLSDPFIWIPEHNYSGPLNTGLDCVGPLHADVFSLNTNYSSTQSAVGWIRRCEPWIWRANCKVICRFLTAWRVGAPNPCVVQVSTIFNKYLLSTYYIPDTFLQAWDI